MITQSEPQLANAFVMQGAREVLEAASGAGAHFRHQIEALESAVKTQSAMAFDLAKGLIDSVCKTILKDRSYTPETTWDTPRLVKETLRCLRLPVMADSGGEGLPEHIRKTAQGLITTVIGICELRNNEGIVAHGRDAYALTLGADEARFAARSADAVIAFLFSLHQSDQPTAAQRRLRYDDGDAFNEWIDDTHDPVNILRLEFRPSEALFRLDFNAYREAIISFEDEQEGEGEDER